MVSPAENGATGSLLLVHELPVLADGAWPVLPDSLGGWRDPSNTLRVLRAERDLAGFGWVTSHTFRKTALTHLDEHGRSARELADFAEHADPSMTLRAYMGRRVVVPDEIAEALEYML